LGSEFAGNIEAVGRGEFTVADQVFGSTGLAFGAHAEFLCPREGALVAHKSAGITFEEAAAICDGALKALDSLRRADARQRQKILIYGASGAIGTAAVQLTNHMGADVTAVRNTNNLNLVRSLVADDSGARKAHVQRPERPRQGHQSPGPAVAPRHLRPDLTKTAPSASLKPSI
jgi:NADPH:quinone reductase-like Zn-dependent oxidoreductase